MSPKIDHQQNLASGGPLTITGPIDSWDPDELAAVFTVVISQVVSGGVAIGIGKSDVYMPTAKDWSANVTVLGGPGFQAGGATAFAWASVAEKGGGWEMYPWGRPIHLS